MTEVSCPKPSLSICIPAYNRPVWLKRAIKSILTTPTVMQPQVEIVVSDDSTIPECKKVVDELMCQWKGRWKYVANSPTLGMARNWNHSIRVASSDYVLILHDDDYLEPEALEKILLVLECTPDISALLFGVHVVTPEKIIKKKQIAKSQQYFSPTEALRQILTDSSYIRFPGMVIRKKVFDIVGYFDEDIGGIADIQMWIKICQEYGLFCVPTAVANYTVHDNALTMKMFNVETIQGLEKIFESVNSHAILSTNILEICKANYFYQFILAGTVRYLRAKQFQKAIEVFNFFDIISIENKHVKTYWKVIKFMIRPFLRATYHITSVQQSSEALPKNADSF